MTESESPRPCVFIATLGLYPSVVTLGLDCLAARGLRFEQAIIIHTQSLHDQDGMGRSLALLRAHLPAFHTEGILGSYSEARDLRPLHLPNGRPVFDVDTSRDAEVTAEAIDSALGESVRAGREIHLLAAGGRVGMKMYALALAQSRFRRDDNLYWLWSHKAVEDRRDPPYMRLREIPEPHMVRLVEAPLPRRRDHQQLAAFLGRRSPKQKEIIRLLATAGLSNKEIASATGVTPGRIANQLETIYSAMQTELFPPKGTVSTDGAAPRDVSRADVILMFKSYFDSGGVISHPPPVK